MLANLMLAIRNEAAYHALAVQLAWRCPSRAVWLESAGAKAVR